MRNCFTFFVALLIASLSNNPGQAQQIREKSTYWLSGGLGKTQFLSGMIAAGYEPANNRSILIGRYSVNAEFMQAVEPGIKVNELGLLYGVRTGNFRFAAGLSSIWGNNRGQHLYTDPDPLWGSGKYYEFISYKTTGVPAEIRFITSLKHVGIGVTAFGNLNSKRSFAGLNLSLYVGKMK
ncbi:hypothetical protein [Spirosoma pomorum]